MAGCREREREKGRKPMKPKRLYFAVKPLEKCYSNSQMEVLLDNNLKGFVGLC